MPANGTEDGLLRQHLNLAANSLLDRASLVQSLMGGSRDIDRDCNYPKGVVPRELYQELYDREPVAARVVEVYPKECWQVQPSVYEDEDSETETAFEAAWTGLATSVRAEKSYHQDEQGSVLWEYLYRADVLSGIGHYGIILLGIDDGKDLSEPADLVPGSVSDEVTLAPEGTPWTPLPGTPEAGPIGETGPRLGKGSTDSTAYTKGARTAGFANGKNRTWSWNQSNGKKGPKRKLTFLRVFPESMAWIDQFDSNPASPRFGQPIRYTLLFNDPAAQAAGIGLQMITAPVHWTRVIHIADNLASSEVFGVPRMQAVLNRLLDIRKIHGGSAEMYWRGAFPGYALETLPQLGSEVDIDEEGVKKMMWDWANGLQRHVVLTGLTMKSLSPQVTDPSPQVNTQIEAICIKLGVPIRIFKGSERGELASSQDDAAWNDRLKQRQAGYVTPRLIVPFVDRLVALGVLPAPEGYSVWWPDLTSKSDQEKAAIASQRTTGLVAYGASAPTQDIITPTDYLIKVQGFDEAEAQSVVENAQAEKDKREKEQAKQQADQLKQQQDQAEAEHQRQLELAAAKGPQQPPPGATGDGSGDGGTGSIPPTAPGGSPGGSSTADTAAGVQNYDPDQPRGESGKWSGGGSSGSGDNNPHEHVEIHDSGTGEVFWDGPRHEAEQMLREQEQVEPGHGLKVRPYDPAAAEARQRQEEARQQAHEEEVSEARRQESLRSPHGLLPGHKDYVDPPERLYHATLAADEIKKSGFKSSDELGHATLGGSSSHLVSFTTRENADHYARSLDVARQAARGELGHDDLIRVGQEYGVSGQRMRELVARHSHNADPATTSFGVLQAVSFEGKKFPLFMGTGWGEHLKSASPASVVSIPSKGLDTIYYNPGEKEWRVGGLKGVTVNYDPDQPRDDSGKWSAGASGDAGSYPKGFHVDFGSKEEFAAGRKVTASGNYHRGSDPGIHINTGFAGDKSRDEIPSVGHIEVERSGGGHGALSFMRSLQGMWDDGWREFRTTELLPDGKKLFDRMERTGLIKDTGRTHRSGQAIYSIEKEPWEFYQETRAKGRGPLHNTDTPAHNYVPDVARPATNQTTPEGDKKPLRNAESGVTETRSDLETTNGDSPPTDDDDLAADVAFFDPDLGPIANASDPATASPWGPGVDPSGNVDEATQADVDAIADQADGFTNTTNEVATPPPVFNDEDFNQ